jgi:hypothetical protein
MIDLPSDEEDFEIAPPPITEVRGGDVANVVSQILSNSQAIDFPCSSTKNQLPSTEVIALKCAWWFRTMDGDPVPWSSPYVPEKEDVKPPSDDGNDSVYSSFGNVSNPDNTDDCQINEISSSNQMSKTDDADIIDQFCVSTNCFLLIYLPEPHPLP